MVDQFPLTTPLVSGLTFGGRDYQTLFVNTGNVPVNPYLPALGEALPSPAGDLFLIGNNSAPGLPSYRVIV